MSRFMRGSSAGSTSVDSRRLRFRLGLFLVKIWRWYALLRFKRPDPVTVNRFLAPLLLFIFGIITIRLRSLYCVPITGPGRFIQSRLNYENQCPSGNAQSAVRWEERVKCPGVHFQANPSQPNQPGKVPGPLALLDRAQDGRHAAAFHPGLLITFGQVLELAHKTGQNLHTVILVDNISASELDVGTHLVAGR
jgi:hypothetical protein